MLRPVETDHDQAQLARLRAALESSGDIIYDWDLATDRLVWIGRAEALFGEGPAAVPESGDRLNGRINPEDLPARMHALSEHFAGVRAYDCEYRVRRASGEFQWVHDRGAVETSSGGTPVRLTGALRLVTQRKLAETRLEHLANYDDLTGLFNKLRLREGLDFALACAQRYDQTGAFLAVGLDQMGRINAAYGSDIGDQVLIAVARRLEQSLRITDIIGRLGSDRFGVVLSYCAEANAAMVAERIIQVMDREPVTVGRNRIRITVSIGAVYFPGQAQTGFDAIVKAEAALLEAKTAGRNCVVTYRMSEAQQSDCRAGIELAEAVTQALKDDRLVLAYQPIVDAATHDVRYHECLLRMIAPDGRLVAAGAFVPAVEQLGLMRPLDRRVLELALRDLRQHPDVVLAINISGTTAADRGWLRMLVSHLKDRSDLASRLIVEITETAALHDLDDTANFVSIIRDLGCQVAIDDFGAGYTTFRHLKALTIDIVKIDGSFVRGLAQNEENRLFIRNLLSLSRAFDLLTVAEFVETQEDALVLQAEGVNLLQGYYFGAPDVSPPWHATARRDLRRLTDASRAQTGSAAS